MKRRTLTTSNAPKILIETRDNLTITGWDQAVVSAEAGISDELVMEQSGNVITVSGDRIHLHVPHAATCIVENCAGQAVLRHITGTISLGNVAGSLILDDVGGPDAPVTVDTVGGEFSAHEIGGMLTVDLVGGHAVLVDVAGACVMDQIGGHLELNQIGAGLSAQVGGHASLSFAPRPGATYRVEAGGNILCALPDDANAELILESPVFAATDGDDTRRIVLGEGGPSIRFEAAGAIRINHPAVQAGSAAQAGKEEADFEIHVENEGGETDFDGEAPFDMGMDLDIDFEELGVLAESFATDLAAKITSKLGVLSERLPGMLASAGLSAEEADEIGRQVQESTQRAAEGARAKAQRAAEKAARKAERRVAKARRKARRATSTAQAYPPRPPRSPVPPRPPQAPGIAATGQAAPDTSVTPEERLTILRMLQEQKINVAQAESLLAALEGRSGA